MSIWRVDGKATEEKKTTAAKPLETFDWKKTRTARIMAALEKQLQSDDGKASILPSEVEDEKKALYDQFEEFKKNRTPVTVEFEACDVEGNFTAMTPERVLFLLPAKAVVHDGLEPNKYSLSRLLGKEHQLYVESIDREKGVIEFRRTEMAKRSDKTTILMELSKALQKGEEIPELYGKITFVASDYALVDLLNAGLTAQISKKYWNSGYNLPLDTFLRKGEIYHFRIIRIKSREQTGGRNKIYLSRIGIINDEFAEKNRESNDIGIGNKSAVIIECVAKPEGKSYWWGRSDRFPGEVLRCKYTDRFSRERDLRVGIRYMCSIKEFTPKKAKNEGRTYRNYVPFEVYHEDVVKLNKLKEFRSKERQKFSPDVEDEVQAKRRGARKSKGEVKGDNEK